MLDQQPLEVPLTRIGQMIDRAGLVAAGGRRSLRLEPADTNTAANGDSHRYVHDALHRLVRPGARRSNVAAATRAVGDELERARVRPGDLDLDFQVDRRAGSRPRVPPIR